MEAKVKELLYSLQLKTNGVKSEPYWRSSEIEKALKPLREKLEVPIEKAVPRLKLVKIKLYERAYRET
ncbi:MAG: hypothetical protein NDP09_06865 [Crenarchaeota archaeon]|nr:hypothetical protein [Thermoproteota archaeon]